MDLATKVLKDTEVSGTEQPSSKIMLPKVKLLLFDLSGDAAYRDAVRRAYDPLSRADLEACSANIFELTGSEASQPSAPSTVTKMAVLIVVDLSAPTVENASTATGEAIEESYSSVISQWVNEMTTNSQGTIVPSNCSFVVVGTKADKIATSALQSDASRSLTNAAAKYGITQCYVTSAANIQHSDDVISVSVMFDKMISTALAMKGEGPMDTYTPKPVGGATLKTTAIISAVLGVAIVAAVVISSRRKGHT
eukprot:GILI01027704.1.p1 GENE.GILI01027704.1~~GILI01027704.1.p1  ORF type:complete len:272 (-),score=22.66 GILI01027704.1:122-877(-)